jgi:hypothetical protein
MLNELFELRSSMEAAGINAESWHWHYKECSDRKAFFLMIAADGTVSSLEPIDDVKSKRFRKYGVSHNFSFPVFNIYPLLYARSDEAKKAVKDLRKSFQSRSCQAVDIGAQLSQVHRLWEICESLWTESEKERISECLKSAGLRQMIDNVGGRIPEEYRAISELMRRSLEVKKDQLQESLKQLIIDGLTRHPEGANNWIDAIVASSNARVSIVLEVADRSSFSYPANHARVIAWINRKLMELPEKQKAPRVVAGTDAFAWPMENKDMSIKFPSVKLPKLGYVILRAMNAESPCQKRYGRIDAKSFPAGGDVRQAMADSLKWLALDERQGKTWQNISNTCGYDKALLFAYPSTLNEDPPELAGLFQPTDPDGQRFEAAAARVMPALQGICRDAPNAEVRIFALAKADQARTKVLVCKNYSVQVLLAGAHAWQTGCQNVPTIKLNIGSEETPLWIEPITPFPTEAVKCLNVSWLQGGKRTDVVHGLGIWEGIELLLETGDFLRRVVTRALSLAVVNAKALLLALGHADHRRNGSMKLDSRHSKYWKLLPGILGLLLYKQNLMKGDFMHTAPFLVGRLLALSDLLHKEYCKHVRNGETPPQLIGNALMSSTVDNPMRGLARLSERLTIYQAWANTARGDDLGLAKWALNQMGSVSRELVDLDLPDHTKDSDKALLLLGYLAPAGDKASENDNNSALNPEQEVSNVRS